MDGKDTTQRSAIVSLNQDNFDQTIAASGIVLVDCWAKWCKPCAVFKPVFDQAASDYPAHTFATLDTMAEGALVENLGVEHVPSLLLFRDGLLLFNQPGYFDAQGLKGILDQAESLDMEQVRSTIEAEQAAQDRAG